MTKSAISGMNLMTTRTQLKRVRTQWECKSATEPFLLSQHMFDNYTVQTFCYAMTLGLNKKRHTK